MPLTLRIIRFILCLTTVALFISGCGGGVSVKNDSRSLEEVISQAELLIKQKAYAAAADQYQIATLKDPTVGQFYLRRAEVLERIDMDKEARLTYERALKNVPEEDHGHLQIMHRLALVNANHLFRIEDAEDLLQRMPENSVEQIDLAAFLYYQASQYDLSIKLLNKALERVRSADQKALLLYHAALVYVKLEDQKNIFGSLFYSINNAEHLGLIRDIEQLWQELNENPKYRSSIFTEK